MYVTNTNRNDAWRLVLNIDFAFTSLCVPYLWWNVFVFLQPLDRSPSQKRWMNAFLVRFGRLMYHFVPFRMFVVVAVAAVVVHSFHATTMMTTWLWHYGLTRKPLRIVFTWFLMSVRIILTLQNVVSQEKPIRTIKGIIKGCSNQTVVTVSFIFMAGILITLDDHAIFIGRVPLWPQNLATFPQFRWCNWIPHRGRSWWEQLETLTQLGNNSQTAFPIQHLVADASAPWSYLPTVSFIVHSLGLDFKILTRLSFNKNEWW